MRTSSIASGVVVSSLASACSGSDTTPEPGGGTDRGAMDDPTESAMGDPEPEQTTVALLEVPAAYEGFQVALEPFEVEPGEEVYYCYRLPLPADEDFDLSAIESRFSEGAHHLLLSTVDKAYDAAHGRCSAGDFGFEVPIQEAMASNLRFLSGAQTPYADDPRTRLDLDEGMAFQVSSEATLLVQLHWVNTTSEVQNATTAVNFLYADAETVMPLESFFFYHTGIELPPQQTSVIGGRCAFPDGLRNVSMVSHMHARGTDFSVHRAGDPQVALYQEDSWAEPEMKFWPSDGLLELAADETVDYRCTFDNDTSEWIYDGDGAGEEMCMLIGLYTGGSGTVWGFPGVDFEGNACTALDPE